jgi:hypothetical protein
MWLALAPVHLGFHGSNAGYSAARRVAGHVFFGDCEFLGCLDYRGDRRCHPQAGPASARASLAAMPLIFAVRQAIEGALWLHLSAGSSKEVVAALSLSFLVFAKVLWPAYTARGACPNNRSHLSHGVVVNPGARQSSWRSALDYSVQLTQPLVSQLPQTCPLWALIDRCKSPRHAGHSTISEWEEP